MWVSQIFTFFAFLLCSVAFKLPGNLRAEKRQEVAPAPGTPLYECHANCGDTILISRTDNYCSNSTFTSDLKACLECALTEDIWQYYGDDVASAAKSCSDSATPSPSSASAATATGSGSTGTATRLTSSVLVTTAVATPTSLGALSATGSGSTASATGSSESSPTSTAAASGQTGAASSVFSSSGASIGVFLTIFKLVQTFF